jgi:hypothetical protein
MKLHLSDTIPVSCIEYDPLTGDFWGNLAIAEGFYGMYPAQHPEGECWTINFDVRHGRIRFEVDCRNVMGVEPVEKT